MSTSTPTVLCQYIMNLVIKKNASEENDLNPIEGRLSNSSSKKFLSYISKKPFYVVRSRKAHPEMLRDYLKQFSLLFSISSSILLSWSLLLFFTVLKVIVPYNILAYADHVALFFKNDNDQSTSDLVELIKEQNYLSRCFTVSFEATKSFFYYAKEIGVMIFIAHFGDGLLSE
jgi:hypothetical protein